MLNFKWELFHHLLHQLKKTDCIFTFSGYYFNLQVLFFAQFAKKA